ncbi:MAG: hypothetical protein L0Z50_10150, partial [Verrucomicrobiales bacterium]|nr:hypothetical protein [Verrucomicrobiales bacterium]
DRFAQNAAKLLTFVENRLNAFGRKQFSDNDEAQPPTAPSEITDLRFSIFNFFFLKTQPTAIVRTSIFWGALLGTGTKSSSHDHSQLWTRL